MIRCMVRELGPEESSPETRQVHYGDREPTAQDTLNSGYDAVNAACVNPRPVIGEDLPANADDGGPLPDLEQAAGTANAGDAGEDHDPDEAPGPLTAAQRRSSLGAFRDALGHGDLPVGPRSVSREGDNHADSVNDPDRVGAGSSEPGDEPGDTPVRESAESRHGERGGELSVRRDDHLPDATSGTSMALLAIVIFSRGGLPGQRMTARVTNRATQRRTASQQVNRDTLTQFSART
jgi:hypothetical protein